MSSYPTRPPLLSICIPTFNRGKMVEERLRELVPQLTPEVEIVVVDNTSTDDTRERVAPFLGPQVTYHRNICNVGGGANFAVCSQKAAGRWIWLLGDDDPISNYAIAGALKEASSAEEKCALIHFSWSCTDHAPKTRNIRVIKSISELFAEFDIGTVLFISTVFYRRTVFIQYAPFYMTALFTYGGHLAIYLHGLDLGTMEGKVSNHPLLKAQSAAGVWWSGIDIVTGLSTVPVFIRSVTGKKAYANAFWKWRTWALRMGFREFKDHKIREKWKYAYRFSLFNHILNTRSPRVLLTDWIIILKRTVWQRSFPKLDFLLLIYGQFGWKWAGDKIEKMTSGDHGVILHDY